jgi:mono/diheme cytochrome c family protein
MTTMLALSDSAGLILLALGALFVVIAIGALVLRNRTKGTGPGIPATMRPGPSDPVLENPQLTKLQGWGVLLVAFFVVWIPISLMAEPSRNLTQEEDLKTLAIERGQKSVQEFSEENQLGVGCVRCHGPELRGGVIQNGANPDGSPRYAYPPNLTNVCAGPFGDPPHAAIFSTEDIYQVLQEGRVANGMPSWSIRYQGALDDMQINDIVNYLVWMSSKNVPFEDNVCLNPEASARALEENAGGLNPRDP